MSCFEEFKEGKFVRHMESKKIAVIILSGGNSSRMNYPKAFLSIGKETLVERLSSIYIDFGIQKPNIVLNSILYKEEWVKTISKLSINNTVLKNNFTELGRSYSISLGLKEVKNNQRCFIQNIDNPDISVGLLNKMFAELRDDSYVVPANNGINGHPILLGREVINHLKNLQGYNWILKDELKKFNRIQVETTENNVLLNLNTEADWEIYTESKQECST